MVFFVLIPMVIGPFIGAAVIRGADEYYEELGQLRQVPTPGIFLAAAVVAVLVGDPGGGAAPGGRGREPRRRPPPGRPGHDAHGAGCAAC